MWINHFTETRTDNEKQFCEKNISHILDVISPPAAYKRVKIKDENKMVKEMKISKYSRTGIGAWMTTDWNGHAPLPRRLPVGIYIAPGRENVLSFILHS